MSSEILRGSLGWKGERGYSAYEVAVMNGYVGTEQDWLASLGKTSHFDENSTIYTATAEQTSFDIPSVYTSNSFIDVYINGLRLNSNEYAVDVTTMKVNLIGMTLDAGAIVEIVVLTMATNNLPITTTINKNSTDTTTPSSKAVYDYVNEALPNYYNGIINNSKGSTVNRPKNPVQGAMYFDTTINKPIWYDGSFWIDSTGTKI